MTKPSRLSPNPIPQPDAASIPSAHDRLLTEAEVAQRQNRSVKTLQNQRVNGGGIPFLKLGRSVRYRLSDVVAWEDAGRYLSTSGEGQGNN